MRNALSYNRKLREIQPKATHRLAEVRCIHKECWSECPIF